MRDSDWRGVVVMLPRVNPQGLSMHPARAEARKVEALEQQARDVAELKIAIARIEATLARITDLLPSLATPTKTTK